MSGSEGSRGGEGEVGMEPAATEAGLRERTVHGVAWSLGARTLKVALQFVISVVLARILTPEDFGLLGMVVVFTGFASLFTDLGFSSALVQRPEIDERHRSSIFWVNLAAGAGVALLVFGSAPLLASFYEEPRLVPVTQIIALNFLLGSLNVVQNALLQRELDFRGLALIEITSVGAAGALGIGLALTGHGVYSLVWKMIAGTAVTVALMWGLRDWRPELRVSRKAVGDLIGFSANLLGFQSFNYWVRSFDDLLIGKVVGSHGLGVYSRAYESMLAPLKQVSSVVGRVMFPSLSKIQDDTDRVKRVYLRTVAIIALVTFPMMLGLLVVADAFVLGLYGPKWVEVIPLLRILCLVGLAQSIGTTTGWIYQSQGRTDWMFRWGLASGTATLVAFIVGIQWGVLGVVIAYTVRNFALTYFNFDIPGRLIGMGFGDVVRTVAPMFGCAAAMAALLSGLHFGLLPGRAAWQQLLLEVPVGAAVYLAIVHAADLTAYRDLKRLAREHWMGGGSPDTPAEEER